MNVKYARRQLVRLAVELLETRAVPANIYPGATYDASNQAGPQSEVGVAFNPVNPCNVVAVSNDITNLTRLPAYYSFDCGASWATTFLNQAHDGLAANATRYDPNVAFDSDGNVYVVYSVNTSPAPLSRLMVIKSGDGGVTYSQAGTAGTHPNSSAIHTAMITTREDPGEEPDDVFVFWALVQGGGVFMQASLSLDGGATFPVVNTRINDNAPERTFMPWAAVDVNGNFLVTWEVNLPGTDPDGVFYLDVLDGATLASGPDVVITYLMLTDFAQSWSKIPAQPDRGIFSVGTIDVDRSYGPYHGRVYFSYTDRETISTNDTNIFVRTSDDGGYTWSEPTLINDDGATNSQFFPRLAVDQLTGWVFMTWYDARQDPTNQLVHVYGTASVDGGLTWLPNVQVTEEPSNESRTNPQRNANNYGEYTGLAAYGGAAYGAWTDARASHFAQNREEVYFGWFYVEEPGGAPGRPAPAASLSFDLARYLETTAEAWPGALLSGTRRRFV